MAPSPLVTAGEEGLHVTTRAMLILQSLTYLDVKVLAHCNITSENISLVSIGSDFLYYRG